MKKSIVLTFLVAAAVSLMSCASSNVKGSGIKGDSATVAKSYRKLVDYQGAVFGREIPMWVMKVADGEYSNTTLSSVMPEMKGKKVFVTVGRGDNLEFVKTWTDQVDVETTVAQTMQRVAAKSTKTTFDAQAAASGKEYSASELSKALEQATQCATLVTLNGLEKNASYWVEVEEYADKKMKTKTSDYYEYYAVWTMDEKLFDSQIKSAVKTIDSNTSEGQALKEALAKDLFDVTVSSNDNKVNEEADEYVVRF